MAEPKELGWEQPTEEPEEVEMTHPDLKATIRVRPKAVPAHEASGWKVKSTK
jgi:hypothetical protein